MTRIPEVVSAKISRLIYKLYMADTHHQHNYKKIKAMTNRKHLQILTDNNFPNI